MIVGQGVKVQKCIFFNSEFGLVYSQENYNVSDDLLDKCFVNTNKLKSLDIN